MDSFLKSLEKKSAERATVFTNTFPDIEKVISSQFQLLAEILAIFRDKSAQDLDKAITIQGYQFFNCCWNSYQNIRSGFLSEGAAVAITALESALYIEYFLLKPHLATRWLDGTQYPIKSFRKLLPASESNQELYLLLKGYTDYGMFDIPRKLVDVENRSSFQLGGIDALEKQFLLIKLLVALLKKALHLLVQEAENLFPSYVLHLQAKIELTDKECAKY